MVSIMRLPNYRDADLEDLFVARGRFLARGELIPGVRPVVAESWRRSRSYGLEPGRLRPQEFDVDSLTRARAQARALVGHGGALLEEMGALLGSAPHVLALADTRGRILRLLTSDVSQAELRDVNLFEGASWHERDIGCNGVGTALAERGPVILIGPEHFQDAYVGWTCIGIPVRANDEIIGVIDLSVPNETIDVRTWGWVLSVARVLELRLGSNGEAAPRQASLGASLVDPLSAVRGVLELLGAQLSTLPSHQRLVRDGLSALADVETRLAKAVDQATELNGVLADLKRDTAKELAELAHEIRNPIGAIATVVELLERTASVEFGVERRLGMIRRQLAVLARLADDLKLDPGLRRRSTSVEPEWLDLRQVVEDAAESASAHIARRGHELILRVPDVPLWLMGDRVRLQQALVNLLSNAAKYTATGGRIELDCARLGDEVVVSIRDSGIGISPSQLARIFDPFSRVGDVRRIEGRGLGLALVQGIAESHGGRVAAHSDGPGRGSAFTLWLPAYDRDSSTSTYHPRARQREASSRSHWTGPQASAESARTIGFAGAGDDEGAQAHPPSADQPG
jgi:signal transduction histidine kinase